MKRSDLTKQEWEAMMNSCKTCRGYPAVVFRGESCPFCDSFDEELKELRKEWAEE